MPRLRFMSAIVRGACVNIFLVALSCVDLKRPAAPYLAYGACVCRFSFFKRMLRILLATVRDARASMFLITLSYGAPKHLEAPYGALRRLRRLRRRFLFFLFSPTLRKKGRFSWQSTARKNKSGETVAFVCPPQQNGQRGNGAARGADRNARPQGTKPHPHTRRDAGPWDRPHGQFGPHGVGAAAEEGTPANRRFPSGAVRSRRIRYC